jgi:hypothetical protein
MRRFSAAFGLVLVASLALAAYGHCRPMLAAQLDRRVESQAAHHHGNHRPQHHHPTEGFGQELSVPGLQAAPPAVDHQPAVKSFVSILLVAATIEVPRAGGKARLSNRARAGPPAFAEFHARTGRLLI